MNKLSSDNVRTMSGTTRGTMAISLPQDGKSLLEDVIRASGHDPYLDGSTVLTEIAQRLSDVAKKDPPWTYRYLRGVLTGNLTASAKLIDAMMRLGALIDGAHPDLAASTQVSVLALGKVAPGALILGDSRRCANPGCPVEFVPKVPWQSCHSAECARAWRKARARIAPLLTSPRGGEGQRAVNDADRD